MIHIDTRKKKNKTALGGILVSALIAIAAIVALAATFSIATSVFSASGYVYIIDNSATGNNVLVYARSADGRLVSSGAFSAHGLGSGVALNSQGALVLTQNGQWLLVVDVGSNEITVFSVHGASLAFASKTSSHGTDPISLAVFGNLVYVLDGGGNGNIAGFTLSSSGVLTYIAGSKQPLSGMPSPSPEQVGFNREGNVLIVTEKATNVIDTYEINNHGVAGTPMSQTPAGSGPYGFAFTARDQLVDSEAVSNSVSSYALSDEGQLRTINGAIPNFQVATCWLVISNDRFAYVANTHSGTISSYFISETGRLTLTSAVAAHVAVPAIDLALTANSLFLYSHNGNSITGFKVHEDGSLSLVNSVTGVPASATGLAAT